MLASSAQTDCPRFTERRDWAQYANGDTEGTPATNEEEVTSFAEPVSESWTMPDGTPQSGTRAQVTAPDGTSHKIYFVGSAGTSSGWQRGLPALVNTYDTGGIMQRQAMTTWTQDNTSVSYLLNPRVSETNVYDPAGNRARTQITYQQFTFSNGTSCHLPRDVYEYAANATTILRSTRTDYHPGTAYTDRHILGLVSERRLYEGDVNAGAALISKVGYFYDNENSATSISGTDAPVQHNNTNYSASFVTGRANLSSVRRYDVTNTSLFTTTSSRYNTAGAVVSSKDALSHQTLINYTDSFSDGVVRNTLAYPTTATDPDGYSATAKYNFDFGAVTSTRTPQPNTTANIPGPEQTFTFDVIGRLRQQTNVVNGAYTRYEYAASQIRVDTYTTIQEGLGEAHSFAITDGFGRVVAAATDHPGSNGGFSGRKTVYDVMGRVVKTSNPTETSAIGTPSQWVATGDDEAAGWIYTQQTYDWKGRPLVTTNQDGTTKTASYAGCGCAGGEVVTLTDEGTINAGAAKKRQQKIYQDVLGRTVKMEVLNWDGPGAGGTGGTIYSTTVRTYNGRDQITLVRQYKGSSLSTAFLESSMTYDGFGRLKTQHDPEQQSDPNNSASTDHTTWNYNADDTIQSIVDARGVIKNLTYNARRLVVGVTYNSSNVPANANVASTSAVSLAYDAAGNRTSMSDGSGAVIYHYDQVNRMDWEERTFSGLPGSGNYRLSYEYNLAGILKKVTDQRSGTSFTQQHDRAGRVTAVTGAGFGGAVTQFTSQAQYRAWGALKSRTHGNGANLSLSYNSRQLLTSYSVGAALGASYQYYNDGQPKFVNVQMFNPTGSKDRAYSYDVMGRMVEAFTGAEARAFVNNTGGNTADGPYQRSYSYDEWNNLLGDGGRYWSRNSVTVAQFDSTNRNPSWSYDAHGNLLSRNEGVDPGAISGTPVTYRYDAAGRGVSNGQSRTYYLPQEGGLVTSVYTNSQTADGDGQVMSYTKTRQVSLNGNPTGSTSESGYWLRSTVLGGLVISEYDAAGWRRTFVYSGTELIGQQSEGPGGTASSIWQQEDPVTGDGVDTDAAGFSVARTVLDPQGVNLGDEDPFPADGSGDADGIIPWNGTSFGKQASPLPLEGGGARCVLDGLEVDCGFIRGEASVQCPNNDCGPRRVVYQGEQVWAFYQAFADGYSGYVPGNARYIGGGGVAPLGFGGSPRLGHLTGRGRGDTNLGRLNGARGKEADLRYNYSPFNRFLTNPQNHQPLPTDLKDKVVNIVNNSKTDCAEFIKKLIGNLEGAFSDDPVKLFERVENGRGFRLGNTGKYAGLSGITSGKREVTIRPVASTTDPRLSEHQAYAYAMTALNELMHQAKNSGVYSDRDLARAISKLLTPDQLAANPLPKTSDVDTNSAYFHSLFNLHCRSLTGE